MGYHKQFDDFDPLNGLIRNFPFESLPDIARRARQLLKGRDREEIVSAAISAGWMIDDYFERSKDDFISNQIERGGWALGYLEYEHRNEAGLRELIDGGLPEDAADFFDFPSHNTHSDLEALKECIDDYLLDEMGFLNARKCEYFAVLSLWLIADTLRLLDGDDIVAAPQNLKEDFLHLDLAAAAEKALQAMDAVGYAEFLKMSEEHARIMNLHKMYATELNEENRQLMVQNAEYRVSLNTAVNEIVKEKISLRAKNAAIKRHEETNSMKADVVNFYKENQKDFRSIEAAAEQIAGRIAPVSHRTVVKWISEYRKTHAARRV